MKAPNPTLISPVLEPAAYAAAGDALDASALEAIRLALKEDLGSGDVTSAAVVNEMPVRAAAVVKAPAVVAGLEVFSAVFRCVDPAAKVAFAVEDGFYVAAPPHICAMVTGSASSVLAAERTALNFLQRLSGIATLTRKFCKLAQGSGIAIKDTRKTTPALRALEKYAVRAGGGVNHRQGLFDGILIKDNHVRLAGGVAEALRRAAQSCPGQAIEVETTTLDEVSVAVKAGVSAILLDNMSPETVRRAVEIIAGRCYVEVSGGINLSNLSHYLIPGVDAISVGALTHSPASVDISLEIEPL